MSTRTIATKQISKLHKTAVCCLLALALAGCLDDGKTADGGVERAITSLSKRPSTSNTAPAIAGSPSTSTKVNQAYTFRPTASDADGDTLTFTIANKPAWASFDASTGHLTGTPSTSYAGVFPDIRIAVTDGKSTSRLPDFSISVAGEQTGSATLSWQPPTSNTDGSPLTNLAGYFVRYGTSPDRLSTEIRIDNPGLTTYMVSGLTPATWYFTVSAFNSSGITSAPSATGSKTIS
jgi:hypothetical protein